MTVRLTALEVADICEGITQPAAQALAGHKSQTMTAHYYEETALQWVQPVRVR